MQTNTIQQRIEKKLSGSINMIITEYPNFSDKIRFLLDYYLTHEKKLSTIEHLVNVNTEINNRLIEANKRYNEVVNRLDHWEKLLEKKR